MQNIKNLGENDDGSVEPPNKSRPPNKSLLPLVINFSAYCQITILYLLFIYIYIYIAPLYPCNDEYYAR